MEESHAAAATPADVRPSTALAMYRDTDWVIRPTDVKDTDEYEENFQRKRRNRILMIVAACFVVVGAAIGVIVVANKPVDVASVGSANVPSPSAAVGPSPTPSPVLGDVLVGGTASSTDPSSSTTTFMPNVTDPISPNTTLASIVEALESVNATVTPEPTTTVTPEPTTTTPAPTTTTPAPTTTTPKPTTTTPAPTTQAPLSAGKIRFVNNCAPSTLWRSHTKLVPWMKTGDSIVVDGTADNSIAYYLADVDNGDYSLFENQFKMGKFWYDLSIIPHNCGASWDTCGGKPMSFNHPIAVTVSAPDSNSCKSLTCSNPNCADAYKFPNQVATHVCPGSVSMEVTFC
ncbi:Aste57867_17011 [Aphanomyces stellatus]|uniref:Aste57867_17011 protein n=1 Tax=Aphanomyces stellatus TaxID=120398 RepID=A0A485L6S6_9STRA|nr:hypothetical protein As57867_016953 [Aphanomyces stellatus]VFT93772.1 Aste57867_17011 [Aphanomyces stellatus]